MDLPHLTNSRQNNFRKHTLILLFNCYLTFCHNNFPNNCLYMIFYHKFFHFLCQWDLIISSSILLLLLILPLTSHFFHLHNNKDHEKVEHFTVYHILNSTGCNTSVFNYTSGNEYSSKAKKNMFYKHLCLFQ